MIDGVGGLQSIQRMGDEQHRRAPVGGLTQQGNRGCGIFAVQIAGGLIGPDDSWLGSERQQFVDM